MIKKILFPVDFSDRCAGAAHFVEALAGRFEAEITMLHVVEPDGYLYGSPELGIMAMKDLHIQRMAECRRKLDEFLAAELKHFSLRRILCEGDPARVIVKQAHDEGADLIMMPSHGFGPFRRFIIGSVTAKVLHDAECPVWTGVHMETAPPLEAIHYKTIVCAIDLGPHSEAALKWTAAFAHEYEATMFVVHASPAIDSSPAKYLDTEFFTTLVQQARQEIEKKLEQNGVSAHISVEGGEPAQVVHQVATENRADLVVIARGSASGGFGRLRTHSYSIIRQSPCPVVSV